MQRGSLLSMTGRSLPVSELWMWSVQGNAQEVCLRIDRRAVPFLFLTLASLISSNVNALRDTALNFASTAVLFLMSVVGGAKPSLDGWVGI